MTVEGVWHDRFSGLADILQKSIETGDDVGASVAVTLDGQPVVDLWVDGSMSNGPSRGNVTRS